MWRERIVFPMAKHKWSNKVVAKVNQLADIIRRERVVSWSRLMALSGLGSSTLYAYKKVLLEICKDIEFIDEEFRVKKS